MNIFIVGVQKCGTTTLASTLGMLDNFELAEPKEPMLFSRGSHESHRSLTLSDTCSYQVMDDQDLLDKYHKCFSNNTSYRIDASTSYFHSNLAIERIKRIFPNARIIILIRHPIKRLHSAYWHYVRTGVALHKLERELEFGPEHLLGFSSYVKWIRKWKSKFGAHVHVACAEDIWNNPDAYLKNLSYFLDIEHSTIPGNIRDALLNRRNSAHIPVFYNTQLLLNYLKQRSCMRFTQADRNSKSLLKNYGVVGLILHSLTKLNLRKKAYSPIDIDDELLHWLTHYLTEINSHINDVVDFGNPCLWWDD